MPLHIHRLVEHAHDRKAIRQQQIKDAMLADGEAPHRRLQGRSCKAELGVIRQARERGIDSAKVCFGARLAMLANAMFENGIDVLPR